MDDKNKNEDQGKYTTYRVASSALLLNLCLHSVFILRRHRNPLELSGHPCSQCLSFGNPIIVLNKAMARRWRCFKRKAGCRIRQHRNDRCKFYRRDMMAHRC